MTATDIPELEFVDPAETDDTYRAVLWAAAGQGKSVAAASAPGPILVLSADRPSAYKFARKHHAGTVIREVRYQDAGTLDAVYRFLRDDPAPIRTLVVDPVGNIVDHLADTAPLRGDGDIDYQWVNKKLLGFVKSLRAFDLNVILVAHEKLNDGRKGDGKLYPALGGPTLINKLLAEMDLVAHIERHVTTGDDQEEVVRWVGQLQPRGNLVCKEGTGALGDRRIADLSRWFQVASDALAPDVSDVPWGEPAGPQSDTSAQSLRGAIANAPHRAMERTAEAPGDHAAVDDVRAAIEFDPISQTAGPGHPVTDPEPVYGESPGDALARLRRHGCVCKLPFTVQGKQPVLDGACPIHGTKEQ